MRKECFTCVNKLTRDITSEEKERLKEDAFNNGIRYPRIPELVFHCKVTGKQISQVDPACRYYSDDNDMVDIRKMVSDTAKKLRKELNKK